MFLKKIANQLTDGSQTFDVWVFDRGERVTLHAVSERDADSLIALLATAINNHTTDAAEIREEG